MSEWIQLTPDEFELSKKRVIRGVQVGVRVSPHNVPKGVRGDFDSKLKRFVIEFKYLDEEPLRVLEPSPFYRLKEGKNSGRLYAIEIDVQAFKAAAVQLNLQTQFTNAIDNFANSRKEEGAEENLDLLKAVIASKGKDLFESSAVQ